MLRHKDVFTLIALLTLSFSAQANFVTQDTGDLVPYREYKLGVAPQFMGQQGGGTNLLTTFDTGLDSESAVRAVLGGGSTDFNSGLYYKWVPYPDAKNQPAVGFRVGLLYARDDDSTQVTSQFQPIVSKAVGMHLGRLNAYTSIPIAVSTRDGEGSLPMQWVIGSELTPRQFRKVTFGHILTIGLVNTRRFHPVSMVNVGHWSIAFRHTFECRSGNTNLLFVRRHLFNNMRRNRFANRTRYNVSG